MSFYEICSDEQVRDLFAAKSSVTNNLKVREDPKTGAFVENVTAHPVKTYKQVMSLLEVGSLARTTASTNMNATSSRSHAVFVLELRAEVEDPATPGTTHERVSKISLVDLAGSERADSTGATGDRVKEAININQSLWHLGRVIEALAKKQPHVPYRDSKLTTLLKDSLSGNSKTVVLATISPSEAHYKETLATLKYVERVKQIVNNAVVNDGETNPMVLLHRQEISSLREEIWEKETKIGVAQKEHLSIVETLGQKQIQLMYKYEQLEVQHAKAVEAAATATEHMKQDHVKTTTALVQTHADALDEQAAAHVETTTALQQGHDETTTALVQTHADALSEQAAAHGETTTALEQTHADALSEQAAAHVETTTALEQLEFQHAEAVEAAATAAELMQQGHVETTANTAFTTPKKSKTESSNPQSETPATHGEITPHYTRAFRTANPGVPFTPTTPEGKDPHLFAVATVKQRNNDAAGAVNLSETAKTAFTTPKRGKKKSSNPQVESPVERISKHEGCPAILGSGNDKGGRCNRDTTSPNKKAGQGNSVCNYHKQATEFQF